MSILRGEAPVAIDQSAIDFEATLGQLRGLLAAGTQAPPSALPLLKVIQASVGTSIRMVPVEDIVYFEAADKYVRVLTAVHEYLIRTPLKELLPQLDPNAFWQIHRGTVVNAASIDTITSTAPCRARREKLNAAPSSGRATAWACAARAASPS